MSLPDPVTTPLLKPEDLVGPLPLKRSAVYNAIAAGQIPTIRYGRRLFVVNALLQQQLGLSPHVSEAGPASPATATTAEAVGGPLHVDHPTLRAS